MNLTAKLNGVLIILGLLLFFNSAFGQKADLAIQNFSYIWVSSKNSLKVKLQAQKAESDNLGLSYDLSKVDVLLLFENRKLNLKFSSLNGVLFFKNKKIILEKIVFPSRTKGLEDSSFVVIDLEKGEVKSPSGFHEFVASLD
ncbi:MAG: hypothetical protein CL678_10420 [Bdellovibrionaceae bacterium]|nr:hypothetical protein [Pseudobdellovibrionaceae bacterium]|tara:strand:- start:1277 stop:1702 length:426 start_codon:yes stop_codon:yes gene_type:complete